MSSFGSFLYSQLIFKPAYPSKSYEGKTVIVTGSNTGLGLEAARHIVRLGAETVILGVRNIAKGNEAKESIEASEKRSNVVQVWQLDLSSYESVKSFAKQVDTLPRIDAIIENAGIYMEKFTTFEGHESTITTNVISTFLLGLIVLPKLKETASKFNIRPHLTIVSSEVHGYTDLPQRKSPEIFTALDDKETSDMDDRYNVSKLLEVFTVREIVSNIKDKDSYPVIINYVNPGLCQSGLVKDSEKYYFTVIKFLLARSTEVGSRTLVLAAGEVGEQSQGKYVHDGKIGESSLSPFVRSEEGQRTQKRVWEELSQILEKIEPGVTKNI